MTAPKHETAIDWRMQGMIARAVGIVALALGFMLGMDGLDDPASPWLRTALGLLATGILAQGYALYCSIKRMQQLNSQS
ncbi:MAG: hypothetical protein LZF86_120116 [Nitrospira sp.]|nr:MAG: hypothetical protein LZF86_120116 [Nitrospira sp.]